ncbi:MAG: hypothetical protein LW650_00735 [Planctomycetaceae bacterium]|nr:hypothetical protein [Phycisphaerales bacterium]MCE2652064.1 hypothetical protein [Planctomycetaceae bacterium]
MVCPAAAGLPARAAGAAAPGDAPALALAERVGRVLADPERSDLANLIHATALSADDALTRARPLAGCAWLDATASPPAWRVSLASDPMADAADQPAVAVPGLPEPRTTRWLTPPLAGVQVNDPQLWAEPPALLDHRTAARKGRTGGRTDATIIELWVDINALRRAAPERLAGGNPGDGPEGRLLRVLQLSNAREVRLAVQAIAPRDERRLPLVQVELTWSARSDPPGAIRRATLGLDAWPAELGDRPTGEHGLALAVRPDVGFGLLGAGLGQWIRTGGDALAALRPDDAALPAAVAASAWRVEHQSPLRDLTSGTARHWGLVWRQGVLLAASPLRSADGRKQIRAALGKLTGQSPDSDGWFTSPAGPSPAGVGVLDTPVAATAGAMVVATLRIADPVVVKPASGVWPLPTR